ncbi:AAA family ATPase [Haloarcula sp. S1AR25-5A]|uniref:AAA family ATPase n=1 Tax=Haloarcula terrestris TaxID=2950533 RepID=A0AAE4F1Y1_9EURY|nr:AAA family ATPase [Haloarcula terrestris]MDS0223464.1 AAA family ATPase [Haloarcula terrestris]
MKLRVENIRYENIREFGDLRLDFTRDGSNETHNISLVQMPNGTGKTTTMELIRHLLLGNKLEEGEVQDFAPDPEYAPEYDPDQGEFSMTFATDSTRFRIHMELDYEMGSVQYRHSYPQREGGGTDSGHFLPLELEDTLTEEFVNLFVFNGELTDDFIETGHDTAENALKIVSRLDRIERQRERIDRIVEKRQENKGAKTAQGLKQLRTRLNSRRDKLQTLKNRRDQLKQEIKEHSSKIKEKKDEREDIIAEDKEALERYKELEEEIQRLQTKLQSDASDLLDDMRRPSAVSTGFNEDFSELLEHMTILKLPKSTSEEFFNELAEGEACICGRILNEEHREKIRKNAEEYLSDEDIGVLNTLKEQLRNTAEVEDFESRFESLSDTRQQLKENEMEQDQLDLDDPELEERKQELTEEIESERNARDEKQQKVDLLTTDDKGQRERFDLDWKTNIPEAKREVNKYKEKVEQASDTVKFSKQADKLEKLFDEFIDRSLSELKERQIQETNERLKQILGLSEVQIESVDDSIKLRGKSGSSEGQSLSVAYAYLSTLFEGSQVDMPFIIDSPAVSLDHKVRREVATIISGLFDQLVAFVISTEKEGFVQNLEPRSHNGSADIQYYTAHKTETPGVVRKHMDRDFFMEFTSEEEETTTTAGIE